MAAARPEIEREMDQRVQALGFELVSVEWAGSKTRPIMRVRVDRPASAEEVGITVHDCVVVSRGLEPWLDEHEDIAERYVLEVSSPGVERPLVRPSDWERFAGKQVAVKGHGVLAERSTRLEAEVLGLASEPELAARLRLEDGSEVSVPLGDIKGAHLLFKWK